MLSVICTDKVRDNNGKITSYVLKDIEGTCKQVTPQQLKSAITLKEVIVINLQIDKLGRLVDKSETKTALPVQQKISALGIFRDYINQIKDEEEIQCITDIFYCRYKENKMPKEVSDIMTKLIESLREKARENIVYCTWALDDATRKNKLSKECNKLHTKFKSKKVDMFILSAVELSFEYNNLGASSEIAVFRERAGGLYASSNYTELKKALDKDREVYDIKVEELRYKYLVFEDISKQMMERYIQECKNEQKYQREHAQKMYTVHDLINMVDPTGYTVKVFDVDTQKEMITEGDGLWTTGESEGINNVVYVYSKEMGKRFKARLGDSEAKTRQDSYLSKEKMYSGKYKVGICINSNDGYKVDCPANPEGICTLLKVGKFKDTYSIPGYKSKTVDTEKWFIRNSRVNREYWVYSDREIVSGENVYTNVEYVKEKPQYGKEVQIIDYTKQFEKETAIENKIKELFNYVMLHGSIAYYDGYNKVSDIVELDKDKEAWNKKVNHLKELYNTLKLEQDFDDYMRDLLPDDAPSGIHWARITDDESYIFTVDAEKIKRWIRGEVETFIEAELEPYGFIDSDIDIEECLVTREGEQLSKADYIKYINSL